MVGLRLSVAESRLVKEHRKVVARCRDHPLSDNNFSVAAIRFLDDHIRAVIAVPMVINEQPFIQSSEDQQAHEVGPQRAYLG
jgi:uncharacterized protein YlxP (DUF503 family)